jgi:hypothetical protein
MKFDSKSQVILPLLSVYISENLNFADLFFTIMSNPLIIN